MSANSYHRTSGNGGKNAFSADIPHRRIASLAVSTIAIGTAAAAPPITEASTTRPTPPAQHLTQSQAQTAPRGALIIADADHLIARYDAIHNIHLSTDDPCHHDVPDPTPTGGIQTDTNDDGIVDEVYWEFSDGTWERALDFDFDSDADGLAIDVTADGFAEIQILGYENCTYSVYQDADGDGLFETEELFTRSQLDSALPGITEFPRHQLRAHCRLAPARAGASQCHLPGPSERRTPDREAPYRGTDRCLSLPLMHSEVDSRPAQPGSKTRVTCIVRRFGSVSTRSRPFPDSTDRAQSGLAS